MRLLIASLILITGVFGTVSLSCLERTDNTSDNAASKPPAVNAPLVPMPAPYPGLSLRLTELISAYESGGELAAAAYAKDHHTPFYLANGMVHVEIVFKPGREAEAVEAVSYAGAEAVETYDGAPSFDCVVPLNHLKSLADNPNIKFISEPLK